MNIQIKTIETQEQLKSVLDMCYRILGEHLRDIDNYRFEDWLSRLDKGKILLYAVVDDKPVSAVLGRTENEDSLIIGFTACEEQYIKQGITKEIMKEFEKNALEYGFKYITLGADDKAWRFYEKCGYNFINEIHGQRIYQKML